MPYTKKEFATLIKEKYPVYKDLEDNYLVDKIIEKYPQYKTQIQEPTIPMQEPKTTTEEPSLLNKITTGIGNYITDVKNKIQESDKEPPLYPPVSEEEFQKKRKEVITKSKQLLKDLFVPSPDTARYLLLSQVESMADQSNETFGDIPVSELIKSEKKEIEKRNPGIEKVEPLANIAYTAAAVGPSLAQGIRSLASSIAKTDFARKILIRDRRLMETKDIPIGQKGIEPITEKTLSNLSDAELYEVYKSMPDNIKTSLVKRDKRVRNIVAEQERKASGVSPTTKTTTPTPETTKPIEITPEVKPVEEAKQIIPVSGVKQDIPKIAPDMIKPQQTAITEAQEPKQIVEPKMPTTEVEQKDIKQFPYITEPKKTNTIKAKKIEDKDVAGSIANITKDTKLPVLKEKANVKNGYLMATDLDVSLVKKTNLPDGMYEIIGKNFEKQDIPQEQYPLIEDVSNHNKIASVNKYELINNLNKVKDIINKGNEYDVFKNILLDIKDGKGTIVSTDSKRLITKNINVSNAIDGKYLINPKVINAINVLDGDNIDIGLSNNSLAFIGNDEYAINRKIDANFPDYKSVFPETSKQIEINKADIVNSLKELTPYVKDIIKKKEVPFLEMNIKDNNIVLSVRTADKNIKTKIIPANIVDKKQRIISGSLIMPTKVKGSTENSIVFDPKELTEKFIKNIDTDKININITDNREKAVQFIEKQTEVKPIVKEPTIESINKFDTATQKVKKVSIKHQASTTSPNLDKNLADFQPVTTDKEFRLWKVSEQIIDKYARRFSESGYIPRMASGVFYPDTKNIFLQSANNVYVVIHEVTHFLDDKTKWFENIIKVVDRTSNGNPIYDPATREIRKLLTDFYVETYPGGSKNHPLKRRIIEGRAMLIQKAVEQPELLEQERWKPLVDMILKPSGKYFLPEYLELIKDGQSIIEAYKSQDALSKLGSRVADIQRKEVSDTFFTTYDKIVEFLFDKVHRLDIMARKAGMEWKEGNPYTMAMTYRYSSSLMNSNLTKGRGLWILQSDNLVKVSDKNIGDLYEMIGDVGNIQTFNNWLIARRVRRGYQELEKKRTELLTMTGNNYDATTGDTKKLTAWLQDLRNKIPSEDFKKIVEDINKKIKEYKSDAEIIKRDNITKELAEEAYQQGLQNTNIPIWANVYDNINKANLLILKDMGRISVERYNEMIEDTAYASFMRDIFTLNTEEGYPNTFKNAGGLSVSVLKHRVGSELPFVGPMYALPLNFAETIRKSIKQKTINYIYNMVEKEPEMFGAMLQRVPLKVFPDEEGNLIYPQLKDPDILMAWENGVPKPLQILDKSMKTMIDNVFNDPQAVEILGKIMIEINRVFTKGTTALYLPFTISNITGDTITAMAQTRTNYKPFYDQIKIIMNILNKDNSQEATYAREYINMGGQLQTLQGWLDATDSPEKLYRRMVNDLTTTEKIAKNANTILDILTTPSEYSEMFTRMAEYINARKKGYTTINAMELAGQVSTPFHHIGSFGGKTGQTIIKSISFMNPAFQALYQFGRTIKDEKTRKRAVGTMIGLAIALIGGDYAIRTASKEQREAYKGLQVGQKLNYIWYPLSGQKNREEGNLGKIKVFPNYALAGHFINMIVDDYMLNTRYTPDEYMQLATSIVPEQMNLTAPTRMLLSLMPQIVNPAIELTFGMKTFPKVMPLIPQRLQRLPSEMQYTETTSKPAIKMARTKLAKALDLSPIEIDYLIEGYMGRASRFVTGRFGSQIFTNPFYSSLYLQSTRGLEFFYNLRDQIQAQKNSMNEQMKMGVEVKTTSEINKLLSFEGRIAYIENMLKQYRKYNEIKNPNEKAKLMITKLRNNILDEVDKMWADYDK